ncbi:MAG: hypothetical protein RL571_2893 [Pseudomonadota bacterium]|jgi:signal transduction histidine kinase
MADQLLNEPDLPSGGIYTAAGTYPHSKIISLINALSEKQRSLTLKIHSNVALWIKSDPLRLRQRLQNLLGSAIKFTQHGYVSILAE